MPAASVASETHLLTRRVLAAWQRWAEAEDRERAAHCLGLAPGEAEALTRLECNLAALGPSPAWFERPPSGQVHHGSLYRVSAGVCERLTAGLVYYRSEVPMLARLVHPARLGGQACLEAALEQRALPDPPPPPPKPIVPFETKMRDLSEWLDAAGCDLAETVPVLTAARLGSRLGWDADRTGQMIGRIRKERGIQTPRRGTIGVTRRSVIKKKQEEAMESNNGAVTVDPATISAVSIPDAEALPVTAQTLIRMQEPAEEAPAKNPFPNRYIPPTGADNPQTQEYNKRKEQLVALLAERGLSVSERWTQEDYRYVAEALGIRPHTARGYVSDLRKREGVKVPINLRPISPNAEQVAALAETVKALQARLETLDAAVLREEMGARDVVEVAAALQGQVRDLIGRHMALEEIVGRNIQSVRDELAALRCAGNAEHDSAPNGLAACIANVLLQWGAEGVEPAELRPHLLTLARQALREGGDA